MGAGTLPEISVLLIEDNTADAEIIRRLLGRAKNAVYSIEHQRTLASAIRLLKQERFDVLLVDLRLPDSDGIGTLRNLQKAAPAAAMIVVTGLDDRALAVAAIEEGAKDYLVKDRVDAHLLARAILRHSGKS